MSSLENAIALAANAHAGQPDKAGQPYILLPLRLWGQSLILRVWWPEAAGKHGLPSGATYLPTKGTGARLAFQH